MLLAAGNRLSTAQLDRLDRVLAEDDPTDEIGAAWAVKELLRQLLAERDPDRIRHKLWRFYDAAARVQMPETTRLAATIETWWPHILVLLQHGVTNARTEGFNRIIKQTKRVACGFRNLDNFQRRILTHIAITRPRPAAARTRPRPAHIRRASYVGHGRGARSPADVTMRCRRQVDGPGGRRPGSAR